MTGSDPLDLSALKALAEAVQWGLAGSEWAYAADAAPDSIYVTWVEAASPAAILALIARVQRAEEALSELVEVAGLRGDNSLPNPADDPGRWTARMQTAWDDAAAFLAAPDATREETL